MGSGVKNLPHINVGRDLGYIVRAALGSEPRKLILGVGSMMSWSEQLKVWCEVDGVEFGGYDELSVDAFDRIFRIPGLGRELGEMMAFMDEFGYAGDDPNVVLPGEVSFRFIGRAYKECTDWSSLMFPAQ